MFGEEFYASIRRKPGKIDIGKSAGYQIVLSDLICYAFMGILLQPVNQSLAMSSMGIKGDVYQLRKVFMKWPDGDNADFPIEPGDQLVLAQGSYAIRGVKPYPDWGIELYVEVPAP
jgi:hypothetical protein